MKTLLNNFTPKEWLEIIVSAAVIGACVAIVLLFPV